MSRRQELETLTGELNELRNSAAPAQLYAIDANLELVQALASMPAYLRWLTNGLPQLERDKLVELNELLPQYDQGVHNELLRIERDRWPHFIGPLVRRVTAGITSAMRPQVVVDLGSGAMEIERQVLLALAKRRHRYPVTFVGIDASPSAILSARNNLSWLPAAALIEVSSGQLADAIAGPADATRLLLCRAGADVIGSLPAGSVDLLFHSYFLHHLGPREREGLERIAGCIARTTLRYDGYRSFFQVLPISLLIWRSPVFLAAFIFSYARYRTRRELIDEHPQGLRFYNNGSYLLETDQ